MHKKSKLIVKNLSTTLIIIGFCNYRENYIKTGEYNNEIFFPDLMDPKACYKQFNDID